MGYPVQRVPLARPVLRVRKARLDRKVFPVRPHPAAASAVWFACIAIAWAEQFAALAADYR